MEPREANKRLKAQLNEMCVQMATIMQRIGKMERNNLQGTPVINIAEEKD